MGLYGNLGTGILFNMGMNQNPPEPREWINQQSHFTKNNRSSTVLQCFVGSLARKGYRFFGSIQCWDIGKEPRRMLASTLRCARGTSSRVCKGRFNAQAQYAYR
jgi:hypothetical protein